MDGIALRSVVVSNRRGHKDVSIFITTTSTATAAKDKRAKDNTYGCVFWEGKTLQ